MIGYVENDEVKKNNIELSVFYVLLFFRKMENICVKKKIQSLNELIKL